jgi:hypothetical protein
MERRPTPQRSRRTAPRRPPRRPTALPPAPGRDAPSPRTPGLSIPAILRGLPAIVGAVGLAFFVVQAALGWGLGVAGAGLTVLVAAMLLAVLVVTDALGGKPEKPEEEPYDVSVCAAVVGAVAVAIACLYLPTPWGGLCAAVVLAGLVVTLHLR